MERNIDGELSKLNNNYSLLTKEFENYEEGKSYFKSRDFILDLMLRMQEEIRELEKVKKKNLTLNNKKNNSNE